MILEISEVAAKKTLVLTLIGGVIMFHWRGFCHITVLCPFHSVPAKASDTSFKRQRSNLHISSQKINQI